MYSKCKTKWMIVAFASLMLAVFAGAAFGDSATTLVIAQAEYAFTFDPIFNWADVDRISRLTFDQLLQYDPGTKAVVPWVAKRWDISEEALAKRSARVSCGPSAEQPASQTSIIGKRIFFMRRCLTFYTLTAFASTALL